MMKRLFDWMVPPGAGDVLGMNRRNVEFVLTRNPRRHFAIANDKLLAKKILREAGVAVADTLTTFESFFDVGQIETRLEGLEEFAIKPAHGSGGRGILVITEREGGRFKTAGGRWLEAEALRRHIADIVYGVYSLDRGDVAIVEPRLVPHPFFAALFKDGLSDIRVIVIDDVAALCMVRVPTKASDGKANLHQGGLGLAVDLETGQIERARWKGALITHHPDNGAPVVGLTVPCWGEIVSLAERASKAVPLDYLGVDLVIDARLGPLVLEINIRPGLEIQNVTGVPLRRRLVEKARERS